MTRVSTHLLAIKTTLEALQTGNVPMLRHVSFQLDALDAEDVKTQSFQTPAAFITLQGAETLERTDGGVDCKLTLSVGVVEKAGASVSADAAALDLSIRLMMALRRNDFEQEDVMPPVKLAARLAQRSLDKTGVAMGLIVFEQTLLRVVPPMETVSGLMAVHAVGGDPVGGPILFDLATEISPEEQAIIDQWGSAP